MVENKTELVYPHGTFEGIVDLEWAILSYVDWFNRRRLHGALGMIPPASVRSELLRNRGGKTSSL